MNYENVMIICNIMIWENVMFHIDTNTKCCIATAADDDCLINFIFSNFAIKNSIMILRIYLYCGIPALTYAPLLPKLRIKELM